MSADQLTVDDFSEFYELIHGYPPFGWQNDLLRQVVGDRVWPDLIDLPTGSGKTSVLDVAVFVLALNAVLGPDDLWAPRRIVMIVDRRIVVDQAHDRAETIANALGRAQSAGDARAHGRVARALSGLSAIEGAPEQVPLQTGLLRGGIVLDKNWSLRPDIPTVLSSTVDQLGSRVLFRGYGESDRSASIHAGLFGNDSLLILDEVHLSRPFMETLQRIRLHDTVRGGVPRRSQTVLLSATPGQFKGTRFPSTPLSSQSAEPELARRLQARKPVRLNSVNVTGSPTTVDQAFAKAVAAEAITEVQKDHVRLLGVVVNRVDTARRTVERLESDRTIKKLGVEVSLITGRMRAVDRDGILAEKLAGWSDRSCRSDQKQIVVATQCIEAGADLDLDGLVSECAAIDALRQRFGRVDRRGSLTAAGTPAEGVILLRGEQPPDDDVVYGSALRNTWEWLTQQESVDFGIEQLGEPPEDCAAERTGAPLLTRRHLRSFSRTAPRPVPDQVVSRWLHGDEVSSADVSVVWRSELADLGALLDGATDAGGSIARIEDELTERIAFCPPKSRESVDVPVHAVRAWLAGRSKNAPLISDTESAVVEPERNVDLPDPLPWVLWRDQRVRLVNAEDLRPGDTVIVPTTVGGISHGNWDPRSLETVNSIAPLCAVQQSGRLVCLLGPTASGGPELAGVDRWSSVWSAIQTAVDESPEEIVRRHFAEDLLTRAANELGIEFNWSRLRRSLTVTVTDSGFVGVSCQLGRLVSLPSGISGNEDDASFIGSEGAPLDAHLRSVGRIAARFGQNLGLPPQAVECLRLAGELHDLGKHDPRFQSWLMDGGPPSLVPMAKSLRTYNERSRRDAARERSGYPKGGRHELLSLRLAEAADVLERSSDPDLVAHLVTSHHGHCRPFAPAIVDAEPVKVGSTISYTTDPSTDRYVSVTVEGVSSDTGLAAGGSGIAARFEMLSDRYGEHGLAWLEAIFRLADHRRSEWETQAGGATSTPRTAEPAMEEG